jgi:predicted RNase H-like HicB family nuclease
MRYAVVIERADGNYSAYVPDLLNGSEWKYF